MRYRGDYARQERSLLCQRAAAERPSPVAAVEKESWAAQLAERYGMPWSIWEFTNPDGMTVIQPTGPALPDRDLLKALGLVP